MSMQTPRLRRVYRTLTNKRTLALLALIGGGVAFAWNKLSVTPNDGTAPIGQTQQQGAAQSQSTAVTVNIPTQATSPVAAPPHEPAAVSDVANATRATPVAVPVDLSGTYRLKLRARLTLTETEAIELVGLEGSDDNYVATLAATFWPDGPVYFEAGQPPVDTRIEGQLYLLSLSAIDGNGAVLRLSRR
jgi:hypothetical protein